MGKVSCSDGPIHSWCCFIFSLGVPSLGALLDLLLFACHLRAWISALESKPNERGAAEHANVLAAGEGIQLQPEICIRRTIASKSSHAISWECCESSRVCMITLESRPALPRRTNKAPQFAAACNIDRNCHEFGSRSTRSGQNPSGTRFYMKTCLGVAEGCNGSALLGLDRNAQT